MRLLLVAAPPGAEAWTAELAEAGIDTRRASVRDPSGVAAALRDPLDLVVAWDDEAGGRAAAVVAAVRAQGAGVPVAVVAHAAAEEGVLRAVAEGAAAVLESGRPRRLPAALGRILEREWLAARLALTGRIAHDLNNLLAPIPLAVQLLQRAPAPSAERGQLDSVQTATRRSMVAVKELSELLAADASLPLQVRTKHLLALASRSWRRLPEAAHTVLTDYPPDLGSVHVDLVGILRLLWCLARRALDAAGSTADDPGALLFSGRDLARGPAPETAGVELRVVSSPTAGFEGRHDLDPVRAPEPPDRLDAVLEVAAAQGGVLTVVDAGLGRAGYSLLLPAAPRTR